MILMVVVDERNGMMFHQRRQSKDRILREKILSMTRGQKLWMNAYTGTQFEKEDQTGIEIAEDFLERAKEEDYCFVENQQVMPYLQRITTIVRFCWNRKYPGDFFFDIDLSDSMWELKKTEEFMGFSHKKITMEVYEHA